MNIKEVAKLAGVSVASVSRAFQNPPSPSVSPKQRERILRICEELRYYPDIHSRRMSRKCSNTITLLSRHINCNGQLTEGDLHFDYNFAAITMGVQHVLCRCGKSLQLVQLTDEFLRERQHLTMVRSKMTDGILFWGALQDDTCIQELLNEKIPLVLLTTVVNHCDCPRVVADEYGGMKLVVEAALEAGHRRFAFLPPLTGFDFRYGREMGRKFLTDGTEATCIITPNDMAAWGCINAFEEAGLKVPADISVIGADGLRFPCPLYLDSFYLPSYEIGVEGTEMLIAMIEDRQVEHHRVLPVSRIAGNSIRNLADAPVR